MRLFFGDVRRALPGGLAVGAAAVVLAAILWFDVQLAASGALPGGAVVGAVGALGLVALALALLLAASAWTPERGWRAALRSVPGRLAGDPAGAVYLVVAVALTSVVTWQLPPLIVPGIGCLVFAVVATGVRERRARR